MLSLSLQCFLLSPQHTYPHTCTYPHGHAYAHTWATLNYPTQGRYVFAEFLQETEVKLTRDVNKRDITGADGRIHGDSRTLPSSLPIDSDGACCTAFRARVLQELFLSDQ